MKLRYQHEVYEGCGDYTNIDIEADSLEDFAEQIACYERTSNRFEFDPERLFLVRQASERTVRHVHGLLVSARQERDRQAAEAKAAKKRKDEEDSINRQISELQSELDRFKSDLTPAAIAARERKLSALREKLALAGSRG